MCLMLFGILSNFAVVFIKEIKLKYVRELMENKILYIIIPLFIAGLLMLISTSF